jgi:hypothetical protein
MTRDRHGVYAFHVRDWRGWAGVRTPTSGSCLGGVLCGVMNNSVSTIALLGRNRQRFERPGQSWFEALPRGILPHRGRYCKDVGVGS